MSDLSQGPGWWQASDGKWYAPAPDAPPAPGEASEPALPEVAPADSRPDLVRGLLFVVGAVALAVIVVAGFLVVKQVRARVPDNAVPVGIDEPPSSDLALAENAVVVRSDGGKAIKSISPDGRRIVIDAGAQGAGDVQGGKTLVLTGVTAIRADQVERQGNDIIVTAQPAALTDVIRDGRIRIDHQEPDLSKAVLRVFEPSPDLVQEEGALAPAGGGAAAGEGEHAAAFVDLPLRDGLDAQSVGRSGTLGGYDYRFNATISGGTVTFTLHLSKNTNGVEVAVDVTAEVSGISFDGDIEISSSSVRQFRLDAPNLAGNATITGSASASSTATQIPITAMQIPMSIQVPFPIAGIPFTVGLDAEAKVEVAFSSRDSHVTGSFQARFDGHGGMSVNNGSLTANGGFNINWEDPLEAVAGLSITPAAVIITIQFPKISLGLGIALVRASAYFEAVFSFAPTISGATNITPCIAEPVAMSVKAGITGEFLGHEIPIAEHTIAQRDAAPFEPQTRVCQI